MAKTTLSPGRCFRWQRNQYDRIVNLCANQRLKNLSTINVPNNNICKNDETFSTSPIPCGSKFKKELDATKFTIFVPVADCGYYGWNPVYKSYRPLHKIKSAKEMIRNINIDQKPKALLSLSQLKVPLSFDMSLKITGDRKVNKYPYGQYDIAAAYVAKKHRKVNLNDVDFIFGGSTFEMLARHVTTKPYMVCRIPTTTNTLLVSNCKIYAPNFADIGYQFERYVTAGSIYDHDNHDVSGFVGHLQLMEIGTKYKVLISAEADALDSDGISPSEIKSLKPKHWGTRVMFQMISSGSPTLCCGCVKGTKSTLTNIEHRSLSDIATLALRDRCCETLELNIMNGMKALQDQMQDAKYGETYKILFNKDNGELSLQRAVARKEFLLPSEHVVTELLS